jgi:hypothetical protein
MKTSITRINRKATIPHLSANKPGFRAKTTFVDANDVAHTSITFLDAKGVAHTSTAFVDAKGVSHTSPGQRPGFIRSEMELQAEGLRHTARRQPHSSITQPGSHYQRPPTIARPRISLLDWLSISSHLGEATSRPKFRKHANVPHLRIVSELPYDGLFKYATAAKSRTGFWETIAYAAMALGAVVALALAFGI